MFARGAGIILPLNFPGADLLIPIRSFEGERAATACILIQVKNRASDQIGPKFVENRSTELQRAASKLDGIAYLGLAMCLRHVKGQQSYDISVARDATMRGSPIVTTVGFGSELFPNLASTIATEHNGIYSMLENLLDWPLKPDYETCRDANEEQFRRGIFEYSSMMSG
ncbi:hypothetical protein KEM56_001605 [Ascosphaera pollenicola]|nr:hypothetical protein KEM56_001605 [Ascosphaera pollenicola]